MFIKFFNFISTWQSINTKHANKRTIFLITLVSLILSPIPVIMGMWHKLFLWVFRDVTIYCRNLKLVMEERYGSCSEALKGSLSKGENFHRIETENISPIFIFYMFLIIFNFTIMCIYFLCLLKLKQQMYLKPFYFYI